MNNNKIIINKIKKHLIYKRRLKIEKKNIKNKNHLLNKVILTPEQENKISDFFIKNFGKNFSNKWHRLYQSYTGKYDEKYYPEILFSTKLEQEMYDRSIAKILEDKALVELLYMNIDGLYFPETLVLNCSGIWYDKNRNIITKEKAIELLKNSEIKLWKTTIDSSSGKSIMITNIKHGIDQNSNNTLEEILKKYKENFIVQNCIQNSNEIAKIYNKSLNTFRVITYLVNGSIYHVPLVLRIGKDGKQVDNIHSGGMFIGISDDGILNDKAFTEYQEIFKKHPDTNFVFKNFKIPNVNKIIEIAYKCHGRTPHIKMISWDFAIDKEERIILIESNIIGQSIWFPQMANGKNAFGKNTEYMLKIISKKN